MREFAKIGCTIWRSRKFRALPNDDARLFYFYCHTNPHANSIGTFWLPEGYALADLAGWSPERLSGALMACVSTGLIDYDRVNEVIRIREFLKHSPITNGKHGAAAVRLALGLPNCTPKAVILRELLSVKWCISQLEREGIHCPTDTDAFNGSDSPIHSPILTETETESKKDPAPNGTAPQAAASVKEVEPDLQGLGNGDPAKLAFDHGLPWLRCLYPEAKHGSLRALIGGWKRDYGNEATWSVLVAAQSRMHQGYADDPKSWITASLKARKISAAVGGSTRPSSRAEQMRLAVEGLRDGRGWIAGAFGPLPGSPGADPYAEQAAAEIYGDDWKAKISSASRKAA